MSLQNKIYPCGGGLLPSPLADSGKKQDIKSGQAYQYVGQKKTIPGCSSNSSE